MASTTTPYTFTTTLANFANANPTLYVQPSAQTYFPILQPATAPLYPQFSATRPISPEPSAVSPTVASQAIQRLISAQLREAGFEGAQSSAMQRLEREVVAFLENLFRRSHEYANLANRSGPIATDLLNACDDYKLKTTDMHKFALKSKKRRRKGINRVDSHSLVAPRPRSPSPKLLPSDEESLMPNIPLTLRGIPTSIPPLPPKHTYLQTPALPPKRAALPSLKKKLETASLVQESLKNLMLATEDTSGQEDAELYGHLVNYEINAHPRKRWKYYGKDPKGSVLHDATN